MLEQSESPGALEAVANRDGSRSDPELDAALPARSCGEPHNIPEPRALNDGHRGGDRPNHFRPGALLPGGQRAMLVEQGRFAHHGVLDMTLSHLIQGIAREDMFHPPGAEGPPQGNVDVIGASHEPYAG